MKCPPMTANKEAVYWKTNPEWWYFDKEKNEYVLTDKATERARRSFELATTPHPWIGVAHPYRGESS